MWQVQELSRALDSATEEIQQLQTELHDATKHTSAERKQVSQVLVGLQHP